MEAVKLSRLTKAHLNQIVSSGKVLVIIKAVGVNPADWKIREGGLQQIISLQFPSTLGMDFSGVIKQVGEGFLSELSKEMKVYGQAGVVNGGLGKHLPE